MKGLRKWSILILLGLFTLWVDGKIGRMYPWPYPAATQLVVTEHYPADVGGLLLGARRAAADMAYIQFLQYYGAPSGHGGHSHATYNFPQPKVDESEMEINHVEEDEHSHDHHHHEIKDMSMVGRYSLLLEYGRRILNLDPFFNGAILEVAGSLAFNQKRVGEAIQLLKEAITLDPTFYRYRLYAAAILYRNEGQDSKLIDLLLEAIKFSDCPPLLENVLGNLLRKYNRFQEALQVYVHIFQSGAYESDRITAAKNINKLVLENPELKALLPPQFSF